MIQYLPCSNIKWVDEEIILNDKTFFNVLNENDIGFILEVDLKYPKELHDAHKDLPFCPEHLTPPGSKQKKLLTTLYDKKRYVIHYRALKQALENGLQLERIHRAIQFNQSPWLEPYVQLNTEKRKNAKNEFEKLFFKLMINAVYGKTVENERKRKDVKLISDWDGRYGASARIAQPNFHSSSIFDENLVAVQLSWTTITIRKPMYVGMSVLDLSKTLIYDFHYGYIKRKFGENVKLLYADTDSGVYEFKDIDMYVAIDEDVHSFDTSDYSENNRFNIPRVNKKVLGVMKDECNGKIILQFIGLRSKMYSILLEEQKPIKKAKGVKTHTVEQSITFEDYQNCLFDLNTIKRTQCNIRSKLHRLVTVREEKVALSPYDDKRCLLTNDTDTLPWGHYKTLETARLREEKMVAQRQMKKRKRQAEQEEKDEEEVRVAKIANNS